jgi:hypothetical protein
VHAIASVPSAKTTNLLDPTDLGAPCHLHMHMQHQGDKDSIVVTDCAAVCSGGETYAGLSGSYHSNSMPYHTCSPSGRNIRGVVSWAQATCSSRLSAAAGAAKGDTFLIKRSRNDTHQPPTLSGRWRGGRRKWRLALVCSTLRLGAHGVLGATPESTSVRWPGSSSCFAAAQQLQPQHSTGRSRLGDLTA